ncbi:hypothetical protein [Actinomadura kijaniata]|uniref:hypothetical protein n=1 Tax=Actinomadura kijaniata TaxID=46161 RepID=UPI000B2AC0FB|nr:hypothetical protein [Actinomadura kijaniata]
MKQQPLRVPPISRATARRAAWAAAALGLVTAAMLVLLVGGTLGWIEGANGFVHALLAIAIVPGALLTFFGAWVATHARHRHPTRRDRPFSRP